MPEPVPAFDVAWPLGDVPGTPPRVTEMAGVTITEQRPVALGVVRGPVSGVTAPAGWTMLRHGPDKALAVGTSAVADLDLPGCELTDVSDARACVRVEGARADDLLAAGCPLDLDALADGDCAASLVGTFHALLHRHSNNCIDVYVARSYAEAFWDWLMQAGSEHR